MPDKKTLERVAKDKRQGKSASTQAGEFVREEIEHIRHGKHGARSTKQAIAIGLSKARRAGVALKAPKAGTTSASTRVAAKRDLATGRHHGAASPARSRAALQALKDEPHATASKRALAAHARVAARKHTAGERSAAAQKAARTKGAAGRSAAARKAARTRARRAKS